MAAVDLVWLVPAFPLVGFLFLMVFGRRLGEPIAGWVATAAMGGSFASAVLVFAGMASLDGENRVHEVEIFDWIGLGDGQFRVTFDLLADPLSVTMILFITGVATLIHLYSIGYMHGDPNFSKFFIYLNMFAFSMLMLVLGNNLLVTFLGWEGVGACSYFLISFWFTDEANSSAGKKAFVTNRVGDFGFMLATFLAFVAFGTIEYGDMFSSASGSHGMATAIALLLFVGAAGKSAQFPLYLWLPDAMAGPTPVSALIHAATMVTSGVYLLARINPILAEAYDWAPSIIAWVGLFTALFAATIALGQDDIKKVLAYSTVSQLGFMVVAVGTGVYVAALFHMITHAFFKALMFLGSGSVIHGMHDDQDMKRYGGLAKLMPITAGTFIVGWLAIAGVPPFSGFWSKDEILVGIYANDGIFANKVLFALLLFAALLTAVYMTRLVVMTFFGAPRWRDEVTGEAWVSTDEELVNRHPHESPWTMTLPLVVLAGAAFVAGGLNLPFTKDLHFLEHWLEPSLLGNEFHDLPPGSTKLILAIVATICAVGGIIAAWKIYYDKDGGVGPEAPAILAKGWGYDDAVTSFMGGPGTKGFDALADFDGTVVDGAVNGVGKLVQLDGGLLRKLQNGLVRSYAALIALGAIALMIYFLGQA